MSAMTFEERINYVKNIPIPEYLHDVIVPSLKGYYGAGEGYFEYSRVEKCPFHNENDASFRYFPDTNSCFCYACGAGGDIIAIHKQFVEDTTGNEPSFKEKVNDLYNWAETHEIEQYKKIEQVYQQNTLEKWQADHKIPLLLLRHKLSDKFKTANTETYIQLCKIERIMDNNEFNIKEIDSILDRL